MVCNFYCNAVQIEDAVSRVAEGRANAFQKLDISSLRSQLGSLAAVCNDIGFTYLNCDCICSLNIDLCIRFFSASMFQQLLLSLWICANCFLTRQVLTISCFQIISISAK